MPKATFLITVYNGERHLKTCLESTLAQTEPDIEVVVIDDGSTDGTAAILAGIPDERVKIFTRPRAGRAKALNEGLTLCSAEHVAILDADDIALPHRIETQLAYLSRRPKFALVGSRYRPVIDEDGKPVREDVMPLGHPGFVKYFQAGRCPLFHSSVMFRKSVIMDLGGYDETLTHKLDVDIYVRLMRAFDYPVAANIDDRLSLKRVHSGQFFGPKNGVRKSPTGRATTAVVEKRIADAFG
jgi:glycosyltransferase involved in cell wall biosynthesis